MCAAAPLPPLRLRADTNKSVFSSFSDEKKWPKLARRNALDSISGGTRETAAVQRVSTEQGSGRGKKEANIGTSKYSDLVCLAEKGKHAHKLPESLTSRCNKDIT